MAIKVVVGDSPERSVTQVLEGEQKPLITPADHQPTADGNWREREGRSRRAKALLRVDDKK
jgi:hypothetical protein